MTYPEGKVVKILGGEQLVINLGAEHGLYEHQPVLVYAVGEEIVDPDSGEPLGRLELVRGRGEVRHVQGKLATVISTEKRRIFRERVRRSPGMATILGEERIPEEVEVSGPFVGAEVGDLVRVLG